MTPGFAQRIDRQDALAALLAGAVGLAGLWFGRGLDWGRAAAMGPGYLPLGISWALLGVAALLLLRACIRGLAARGRGLPAINLRPLIVVTISTLLFGALLERVGLAVAVFVTALLASFASSEAGWLQRLLLAAILSAACAVVFVYLLGQPIALWWWAT
jgi:hypothetical protein